MNARGERWAWTSMINSTLLVSTRQRRQHLATEQLHGIYRIGGEADREHERRRPRRLGGAHLADAVFGCPRDGEPGAKVVEKPEPLHQIRVHLPLARRVARSELAQARHELRRNAASLRVGPQDVRGDKAQDIAELLECRLAPGAD